MTMLLTFTSILERDKDATRWYAHVPKDIREALKHHQKRGGTIPVTATIGHTTWEASLMPWADGSAQTVIKQSVRDRENLHLGDQLTVQLKERGV